jgi:exopolyphosphatase/guanosine-5'-triphosphate,3'-diphosphate pyrophosphatase
MNQKPPVKDRRNAAFMDIGTTSIRMLIVGVTGDKSYSILSRQKEMVRLGDGEFGDRMLRPEAMERAIVVCRRFSEMARAFDVDEIVAVATSATRDARNQGVFVSRLREEAGLDVRVVSGLEEARLIYLGVSRSVHIGDGQALFIDVGGGSTELIVGDNQEYSAIYSLQLGTVRLAGMFDLLGDPGPVSGARYKTIRRHVYNESIRVIQELRDADFKMVIGSSGTIETLVEIGCRVFDNRKRTRDDVLTRDRLKQVIVRLCELPLEERRKIPGMNPRRADIIVSGAAIVDGLMKSLALCEIRPSDSGLQHGLLVDYLASNKHDLHAKPYSVRERSVLRLGRACHFDEGHARQVAAIAESLFDAARGAGLHSLGDWERELLTYAALLHDIGMFVSVHDHEAHAHYLIRHSNLLGFDDTELAIVAAAAFFHKKRYPRKKYPEFAALDRRSGEIVRVLSMFLRLAESLDRTHTNAIERIGLAVEGDTAVLEMYPRKDCQLEEWNVPQHAEDFHKTFGKKLVIVKRPSNATV